MKIIIKRTLGWAILASMAAGVIWAGWDTDLVVELLIVSAFVLGIVVLVLIAIYLIVGE